MTGLHAAVLASIFLAYHGVTAGYGVYGYWPQRGMLVLAGVLFISSLISIFKCRPLAVSGLLLAAVVVFLAAVTKEKIG